MDIKAIKLFFIMPLLFFAGNLKAGQITVNHLHTDIDLIPDSVFETVKDEYRIIHGHLSHGWQIDDGLDSLELTYTNLSVEIGNYDLPHINGSLNIMYYYAADEAYWYKGGAQNLRG